MLRDAEDTALVIDCGRVAQKLPRCSTGGGPVLCLVLGDSSMQVAGTGNVCRWLVLPNCQEAASAPSALILRLVPGGQQASWLQLPTGNTKSPDRTPKLACSLRAHSSHLWALAGAGRGVPSRGIDGLCGVGLSQNCPPVWSCERRPLGQYLHGTSGR